MSTINDKAVSLYLEKAKLTAVEAVEAKTMQEALEHAITVCEQKEFCKLLLGEESAKAASTDELPRATVKTIAAPGLEDKLLTDLTAKAKKKGFTILTEGMRDHMAGIDVTVSVADFALADTATCCLTTDSEEKQLATMICETHVIILPKSKLLPSTAEAGALLQAMTEKDAAYTSFITGPSRTADIERVLALGVHGPLEMHVVLLEA